MWLIIVGVAVLAGYLAVHFGFIPPPNARTLVQIRDGRLRVERGLLKPHAKENVSDVLSTAGVSRAFIAITSDKRVAFSRQIPSSVHQRLRNILLNQ